LSYTVNFQYDKVKKYGAKVLFGVSRGKDIKYLLIINY
jgi:hypothetical protein